MSIPSMILLSGMAAYVNSLIPTPVSPTGYDCMLSKPSCLLFPWNFYQVPHFVLYMYINVFRVSNSRARAQLRATRCTTCNAGLDASSCSSPTGSSSARATASSPWSCARRCSRVPTCLGSAPLERALEARAQRRWAARSCTARSRSSSSRRYRSRSTYPSEC